MITQRPRIEVTISVRIVNEENGDLPERMTWEHEERLTGSRFLADAVQAALTAGTAKAVSAMEKHVDLRENVR